MGGSLLGIALFYPYSGALAAGGFPSSLEEEAYASQGCHISSEIDGINEISSAMPFGDLGSPLRSSYGLPLVIFDMFRSCCVIAKFS